MLSRDEIARLIPHQGAMVLLASVEHWDAVSIHCRTTTHRDPTNPLRRDGRLACVCLVECGLQAMALHGALTAGTRQRQGFVTSLREVELATAHANDLATPLDVRATLLAGEPRGYVYRFEVTAGADPLTSGEATVFLPDPAA